MNTKQNTKDDWYLLALETPHMDFDMPEMQYIVRHGMCNAFDWMPFITERQMEFLKKNPNFGVALFLPADLKALSEFRKCEAGRRIEPTKRFVEDEWAKLAEISRLTNGKAWWVAFPEVNSSQSAFVGEVYRRRLRFKSRRDAYQALKRYVLDHDLFQTFRRSGRTTPKIMSIAGPLAGVQYAYEWGADLGLAEINIGSLSDIHPAIAVLRGAARQYRKPWGLDVSHWRLLLGPTMYDDRMRRVSGWSESYIERNLYLAFMAGANFIRFEEAVARHGTTAHGGAGRNFVMVLGQDRKTVRLTPMGRALKRFADFSLRECPNRRQTHVPVALMLDHYNGWQPRNDFWKHDTVWFNQLPFRPGDYMIDNFMDLIYPGYHRSGSFAGAPYALARDYNYSLWEGDVKRRCMRIYEKCLAEGFDTRPFEPISTAAFGDSFDIITSNASFETLRQYETVILLGEVGIGKRLAGDLACYVRKGGRLMLNVKQAGPFATSFLGVRFTGVTREDNSSRCRRCGEHFGEMFKDGNHEEPWYAYAVVKPTAARIVACNDQDDALITENRVGQGRVVLTTPHYNGGKSEPRTTIRIVEHYLRHLMKSLTLIQIEGGEITHIINRTRNGYLLMLMNNHSYDWNGCVRLRLKGLFSIVDMLQRTRVSAKFVEGEILFPEEIPAFRFGIYLLMPTARRK